MHRAVISDDRARRTAVPALVQDPILAVDRLTAQVRVGGLAAHAAEGLPLPLHDVGESVLAEPALARDPRARPEAWDRPAESRLAELSHDAIEGAVLRLYASDGLALGVAHFHHRMSL